MGWHCSLTGETFTVQLFFSYKPSNCIWNDHRACNVPFRQGETWTTTRTEVSSNSEKNSHYCQLQRLLSSTFLAVRAEGQGIPTQAPVTMWAQLSSHPSKGTSFSWVACLQRKERMLLWLKRWAGIQVLGSICSVISCLICGKPPRSFPLFWHESTFFFFFFSLL